MLIRGACDNAGTLYALQRLDRSWYEGSDPAKNPYTKPGQPWDEPFHIVMNLAIGGGATQHEPRNPIPSPNPKWAEALTSTSPHPHAEPHPMLKQGYFTPPFAGPASDTVFAQPSLLVDYVRVYQLPGWTPEKYIFILYILYMYVPGAPKVD